MRVHVRRQGERLVYHHLSTPLWHIGCLVLVACRDLVISFHSSQEEMSSFIQMILSEIKTRTIHRSLITSIDMAHFLVLVLARVSSLLAYQHSCRE